MTEYQSTNSSNELFLFLSYNVIKLLNEVLQLYFLENVQFLVD